MDRSYAEESNKAAERFGDALRSYEVLFESVLAFQESSIGSTRDFLIGFVKQFGKEAGIPTETIIRELDKQSYEHKRLLHNQVVRTRNDAHREIENAQRSYREALAAQQRSIEASQQAVAEAQKQYQEAISNIQHAQEAAREATRDAIANYQEAAAEIRDARKAARDAIADYQEAVAEQAEDPHAPSNEAERASGASSYEYVPDASGRPAIQLLQSWLNDETGYDEETWPEIEEALDQDRPSNRKLFVD